MTDQMIELARRAVACEGWRWMEGMLAIRQHDQISHRLDHMTTALVDSKSWLPDLTDPATLGCLLHLVREAWSDPTVALLTNHLDADQWYVWGKDLPPQPTEAHALVAALEAAP